MTEASAPPRSEAAGRGGLPEASLPESLRFAVVGLLPNLVRGLFSPRPAAVKLLARLDSDGRAVAELAELRRRHGGQGVRLLGGRIAVLWGVEAIREVLDRSAETYASDAGAKGKGMSHFMPDALTLSRGEEWRDRRAFNESVLATSESVHPLAERFVAVVGEEVDRLHLGGGLRWADWEKLFDHITLRVIFGDRSSGDQELTGLLESLMAEANRLVGLDGGDDYYALYGRLERKLQDPEEGSLLSRFADAPQSDRTRVVHQVPHWMFAMRDTLASNTYRALTAIVADPEVERRVLEEVDGTDLSDPSAIDGLTYLKGGLSEAMRLWPTTPLLVRETIRETTLAGEKLDEGTQVMIVNTFNHRDGERVEDADRFCPERWSSGERDYRFNHLSNGSQDCPGGPLVYLLGKAVLARILAAYHLTLREEPLDPGEPLPYTLDPFTTSFAAQPRA